MYIAVVCVLFVFFLFSFKILLINVVKVKSATESCFNRKLFISDLVGVVRL